MGVVMHDHLPYLYTFVCPSREVAGSTPSHRLAFRSTEKPGRLGDGWAESAWVTSAKGLDV